MIVVLQIEPLWGTAESVTALYGIPRRRLLELARCGHIRARKLSPDSRSATIVFRTADVKDWLEHEAPKPRSEAFGPCRGPGIPGAGDDGEDHAAEPSLAPLADGHAGGGQ